MVRASGLARNNAATFDLIDLHDDDTPTGLQLMARAPCPLRPASGKPDDVMLR